jgi:hypothetical protein
MAESAAARIRTKRGAADKVCADILLIAFTLSRSWADPICNYSLTDLLFALCSSLQAAEREARADADRNMSLR